MIDRLSRLADAMSGNLRGMLWMTASTVGFASMHALIREMSGDMHPFQIAFFRNFFGMFFVLPWVIRFGLQPLRTNRFGLHLVRAASNVVAMLLFFYALSIAPLADVAALGFTAPLYATILTMLFLKEKVGWRRWSAILIGFAGALVVLRPGLEGATPGHIMVIVSSAIWGFCLLVIKTLSRTDSSVTITAWMVLLLAPMSLVPALFVWTWPSLPQIGLGLAIGLLGTAAQMIMTQSLKVAETSVVMPLEFMKLIWAALLGFLFFAEIPDLFTWVGGAIIFASATYIVLRERKLALARRRLR